MDNSDIVELHVSSNIARDALPRRFSKSTSISSLKGKLELITGGAAGSMSLSLYDTNGHFVCCLDDETRELGSFSVQNGMRIHVDDRSISQFDPNSSCSVEKFDLTDDQYDSKKDTLRSYLRQTKQGKYDAEEMERLESVKRAKQQQQEQHLASLSVGARCEVARPGHPTSRGCVKFMGATDFGVGVWVGVHLDEPMGKNNGSVNGRCYFECDDKYGVFVRPNCVQCGDFPELSLIDDEEM